MSELAADAAAPSLTLPSDGGATVSLADYHGKKLALYLYPRADTRAHHIPHRSRRQNRRKWAKVKVDGHAEEVLAAAKALGFGELEAAQGLVLPDTGDKSLTRLVCGKLTMTC